MTRTHQQGLNDVVTRKVERMIETKAPAVQAAIKKLIDEAEASQDYIAPIGVNLKLDDRVQVVSFGSKDKLTMSIQDTDTEFTLHDNAIWQLSDKMKIPSRYLRELAQGQEWERGLAARILNTHSGWTQRSRVLLRTVDQEVRGVLSDSYRRLNSVELMTAFMQEVQAQSGVIVDAFTGDTRVWCETILPTPLIVPTANNGEVIIYAGARFSTSDYGDGAVDMRSFLMNGACLNGMVRESIMRQFHLGKRLPDDLELSNKTYELDTQTSVSTIRDLTKGLFGRDQLMRKALEIQGASALEVDLGAEVKKLIRDAKLLKAEGESVEKILMQNNPDDGVGGGATLWKLTQGITAHARDLTPRRSRDLHEIAGLLLNRVKVDA